MRVHTNKTRRDEIDTYDKLLSYHSVTSYVHEVVVGNCGTWYTQFFSANRGRLRRRTHKSPLTYPSSLLPLERSNVWQRWSGAKKEISRHEDTFHEKFSRFSVSGISYDDFSHGKFGFVPSRWGTLSPPNEKMRYSFWACSCRDERVEKVIEVVSLLSDSHLSLANCQFLYFPSPAVYL